MSRYLIEERPLTVLPTLVKAIGLEKALVLQQLYWLQNQPHTGKVLEDGLKWIWGTYEEWCELYFTMWKPDTLRKHIGGLEKLGLLLSCQPNVKGWDRTKYYRVETTKIAALIEPEDHATSNREDDATSRGNFTPHRRGASHRIEGEDDAASYKEQIVLTDSSAETTTDTAREQKSEADPPRVSPPKKNEDEKNRSEVMNLMRRAFSTKGGDPTRPWLIDEMLEEMPSREAWLQLPYATALQLFQEATRLYENEKQPFKATFKKLLNRATAQERVVKTAKAQRTQAEIDEENHRLWLEAQERDREYAEKKRQASPPGGGARGVSPIEARGRT